MPENGKSFGFTFGGIYTQKQCWLYGVVIHWSIVQSRIVHDRMIFILCVQMQSLLVQFALCLLMLSEMQTEVVGPDEYI